MKKRAFTLVELMVVLAIIALLSALIFGAISSLREGNKRGSCQSNLNQIYAAARLYAQDNDGQFPYMNPSINSNTGTPQGGLGLWTLYVYGPLATDPIQANKGCSSPSGTNGTDNLPPLRNNPQPNSPDATLASYLKSTRVFHCPSDNFQQNVSYSVGTSTCASATVLSSQLQFFDATDGTQRLNPFYLSYQGFDDLTSAPLYSSFRKSKAKRQMRYFETSTAVAERRPPDQTIVTWCRFHRSLKADGTTKDSDFSRTFDNVLFLDGSVQSVPVKQTVTSINGKTATCQGWQRVPLAEANSVPDPLTDSTSADFCG